MGRCFLRFWDNYPCLPHLSTELSTERALSTPFSTDETLLHNLFHNSLCDCTGFSTFWKQIEALRSGTITITIPITAARLVGAAVFLPGWPGWGAHYNYDYYYYYYYYYNYNYNYNHNYDYNYYYNSYVCLQLLHGRKVRYIL